MRTKYIFLCCLALGFSITSLAQEEVYMTGLLPDDGTYEQLERKKELLTRDYTILPSSYSLLKYCPIVKSQSQYSTCTSWATAYAARTIAEAIKYDWTDKGKITGEAFSPLFVYAQIKDKIAYPDDYDCKKGTHIFKALQLMKEKGVPKFSDFNVLCANSVSDDLMQKAQTFKINDYFTLFSISCTDGSEKIRKVKKALSEDCPVIIAMHIPQSFHNSNQTWNGQDVDPTKHGYHAMCVVGYDDNMQGGAFYIMNSWGTNWGENGFVWVKYNDFAKYVDQAYEMYVRKIDKTPPPAPKPTIVDTIRYNHLAGKIELQLSTGEKMVATLHSEGGITRYNLNDSYISGTRYRLYISNNEPAYVYVIGADLTGSVSKVFPPKENISAALTYKSNHIAIPDEQYFIEMDQTKGTDYMCVLYSQDALDINAIINQMRGVNGSFYDKLNVLNNLLITGTDVTYGQTEIRFQALSQKTVVPVVIEIPHK